MRVSLARRVMGIVIAFALLLVGAAAASAQVKVTQEPVTLRTRMFDPNNPPAEMPKLGPREIAQALPLFSCQARTGVLTAGRRPSTTQSFATTRTSAATHPATQPTVTITSMD